MAAAGAVEDSWVALEPMPTAREDFGVAVVDGKIYAIGGDLNYSAFDTNEMYDPETNTWTTMAPMPTARTGFGIAVYENKIHVLGGEVPYHYPFSTAHEVYDPVTDTWETKKGTYFGGYFCANVANGKLYVMGGAEQNLPPAMTRNENMVYDSLTDSWTELAPMPVGASGYASAVVDNKIYVIDAIWVDGVYESLTQIYDTETDTWSNGATLPIPVGDTAAVVTSGESADKRIYVVGGTVPNEGEGVANTVTYVYTPETDSWSTAAGLITPRYSLSLAVVDDKLYAIGGRTGDRYNLKWYNNNEMYTPTGYIPEFSSWIVLPFFIVATVIVIFAKIKLSRKGVN